MDFTAAKLGGVGTVESSSKFLRAASPRCGGGPLMHTQSKLCVRSVLRFREPAVVRPMPPRWHLSTPTGSFESHRRSTESQFQTT